jgi:hypothetical protein
MSDMAISWHTGAARHGGRPDRIRARQRLHSVRGRRAGEVDVRLDREGDAVEPRQVCTTGDRTVSRLGRFQRLLTQDMTTALIDGLIVSVRRRCASMTS